ncbi:MAG: hypothetical protein WAW23_03995 [Candidatus Methanoperedens sp.]
MSKDSSFNRGQKKEEERSVVLDFSGSLGKGMLAKEKIETLGNSSGLTPLGFGVNVRNRIMDRDSADVGFSTTEYAGNTEILNNSSGLSPLCPFGEIYSINKKNLSLVEGFSATEGLETLRNFSGLTPLNFDIDERRYSLQRTLRTQSPGLTNFAYKGE